MNILKDLTQLKTLILRNNCIENLDKSVFQKCINFTKLELSDNKLTEIDFEIFSKLTKLSQLNLNSNKLKSLNDKNQTLTSLESLELIDLNCNQLALVNLII